MRYLALACDYDGTIAHHGRVDDATIDALERLRASGRKLLLVTGREMDDLMRIFPRASLFDRIVAENGALIYDPSTRDEKLLGPPPPPEFVRELERRGVTHLSVGRVIVATWEPHDKTVHDVIRDMALELQMIFNKGAVMVLPSGLNKAVGLRHALDALKLSSHNTVGVGDAENDHAFLRACECGVAVANALDSVKARVDWVTPSDHGAGVIELIDGMIDSDLAELGERLTRRDFVLGQAEDGTDVRLSPYDGVVLMAGPSGAGKTTVTTALLERLCTAHYQFCVVDPEGDYYEFAEAISLRGAESEALAEEALQVLDQPSQNAIATLIDMRLDDRPEFLQRLLPRLLELRARTARPHWIVIDEAHHLLPPTWQPSATTLPAQAKNIVLVTVHPDHVARAVLDLVDTLIVVGRDAQETLDAFARGRQGDPAAKIQLPPHSFDPKLTWFIRLGAAPLRFRSAEPTADRRRHQRKYAAGELGEDKSFYFRGSDGRLNLRAQNLELFLQMADGVDDDTWRYHLREQDVSKWFRDSIKDDALAKEAADIEANKRLSPSESRARIRAAIEGRYTAPA
jgi:hydroxymethylpyrimidine pyrophosphatase-like HAD family hydrolase